MAIAIQFERVSKRYRLGSIGPTTLTEDMQRFWARVRRKPDPFSKIGQIHSIDRMADKSGDSSRYTWALWDINLSISQGEILGILGRNGAGKSTLLKILSRITTPSTGSIGVRGRVVSLLEVGTGFHTELSGRENIYLNGSILGMTKLEVDRQLEAMIDFSGCAKYIDTPVKRYSSGMAVRLGFAVAAHLRSEILIVDEALAVGDIDFQKKCIDKMREVARESGRTVLFVSHSLFSIKRLCTSAVVLDAGQIAFHGSVDCAIVSYNEMFTKERRAPDLRSVQRQGDGRATFAKVRIFSMAGEELNCVRSGDDFEISLQVDWHGELLSNCVASIALKDEFGHYVWLVRSSFDGFLLDLKSSGRIICTVHDFALAPGDYNGVVFLSERDNQIVDLVDDAFFVRVEPGHFFRSGSQGLASHCKTLTRAEWKVG